MPVLEHKREYYAWHRSLLWSSRQRPVGISPPSRKDISYPNALAFTTFFFSMIDRGLGNEGGGGGKDLPLPFGFGTINSSGKKGLHKKESYMLSRCTTAWWRARRI